MEGAEHHPLWLGDKSGSRHSMWEAATARWAGESGVTLLMNPPSGPLVWLWPGRPVGETPCLYPSPFPAGLQRWSRQEAGLPEPVAHGVLECQGWRSPGVQPPAETGKPRQGHVVIPQLPQEPVLCAFFHVFLTHSLTQKISAQCPKGPGAEQGAGTQRQAPWILSVSPSLSRRSSMTAWAGM